MAKKTTKKSKNPRLTLHQLLGALSFWGSTTRLLLVGFLVMAIFVMRLIYLDNTLLWEAQVVIYVLGSFAVLDIGYVMLARAFPLRKKLDVFCLLTLEILLAATYILPHLISVGGLSWFSNWFILIVLLAVAVRGLLGLLFSTKKRA